jgi:quercetin dioxygenase-like cupin family protein
MRRLPLLLLLLLTPFAHCQTGIIQSPKTENPVSTRLLDETGVFRAVDTELAPGGKASRMDDGFDRVIVVLAGKGISVTNGQNSTTVSQGQVLFLKRNLHSVITNSSENVSKIIDIVLKQHWDADVHSCGEPKKCSHPILMGTSEIGHSAVLFSSGFVTAYRHELVLGGTLSSSYFSSNGKDHLMLVALTDLQASFDGTEEQLRFGQVYTSEAAQVEVTATKAPAAWVMLRVETPK